MQDKPHRFADESLNRATPQFRKLFDRLEPPVQEKARVAYKRFLLSAQNVDFIQLKQAQPRKFYRVKFARSWRAVAEEREGVLYWLFIGHKNDYMRFIADL